MENYRKVYVAMLLRVSEDGNMKPVALEWTDGTVYEIDKITDVRNSPPEHTGGLLTVRYRVKIYGREKIIYMEKQTGKWFVERLA